MTTPGHTRIVYSPITGVYYIPRSRHAAPTKMNQHGRISRAEKAPNQTPFRVGALAVYVATQANQSVRRARACQNWPMEDMLLPATGCSKGPVGQSLRSAAHPSGWCMVSIATAKRSEITFLRLLLLPTSDCSM
jgi:hypothetical protein